MKMAIGYKVKWGLFLCLRVVAVSFAKTYDWLRASQVALVVKTPPADAGDPGDAGLIPGLERSPGGGHGNSLQYSCLENPMDRGAWWATVHGVAQSRTRLKRLSTHAWSRMFLSCFSPWQLSLILQKLTFGELRSVFKVRLGERSPSVQVLYVAYKLLPLAGSGAVSVSFSCD